MKLKLANGRRNVPLQIIYNLLQLILVAKEVCQIEFDQIQTKLLKFINNKEFNKFKRIKPKKIENIINLNKYVRLKIKP